MIRRHTMINCHIPYDVTGIIFKKMNNNIKSLFDDEVLLKFIIKHSNIHPETLLIWFVKQQREKALVVYTTIKAIEVLYISDNVFILLCKIAIKNSNTNILKHLLNVYLKRLKYNASITNSITNLIIEVYIKKRCLVWITILKYVLNVSYNKYKINNHYLIKVLEKDKSKKLIKLFLDNQCVNVDILETKVINYIIIYNHLNLLKFLVVNGYEIRIYDIIVSVSSSNCKMVRYIANYFKPRLYTKGFRKVLLSIAAKRNNEEIYKYVYQRFK